MTAASSAAGAREHQGNEAGFTLVELMIVMVMTSVFVGIIMFFTFNYWRFGYALEADLDTMTQRLNAGDFIRESVGTSSGLITQNSIPDSYAMVPDPTAGATYWLLKHAIPANVVMPAKGSYTALLYYRRPSTNTSNAIVLNGTQPYEDEYVIYLDGTKKAIRVRTLANAYALNNRTHTSCPDYAATSVCPADRTLISNIASVDIRYFSRNGVSVNWTSIYDASIGTYIGPDFPVAEVVELTLNLARKEQLQKSTTTKSSTIIRIALRNT